MMLILKILAGIGVLCILAWSAVMHVVQRDFEQEVDELAARREAEEAAEEELRRAEDELWPRADAEAQAINARLWEHTASRLAAEAQARAYWIYRSSIRDDVDSYLESSWASDKAIAFWEEAQAQERAHEAAVAQLQAYANGWAEEDVRRSHVRNDATKQAAWDRAKQKCEAEEAAGAKARAEAEEKDKADAMVEAMTDVRAMFADIMSKPSA